MADIILVLLVGFLANLLVGVAVCAYLDMRYEGRLLAWADQCPSEIIKAILPSAWPLFIWLYIKDRRSQ